MQKKTSADPQDDVAFNDGDYAEVDINGVEGVEKGLWLDTMQISVLDAGGISPKEFRKKFPVGMLLDISTATEITKHIGPLTEE